ncbi:MAG: ComF family protein [Nitrospirae bacterium]|nr:ComF family protein [Nitrospirota bacterium]
MEREFLQETIRNFSDGFLNLIFPLNCLICRRGLESDNKKYLCNNCWAKVRLLKEPLCSRCGRLSALSICLSCKTERHYFQTARAVGLYEGVLRECIHLLKYGKKIYLAQFLGELLAESMRNDSNLRKADLLVPVPLDERRYRERDFNQAYLLAQVMNRYLKTPVSARNLSRTRIALPQARLNRKQRRENVRELFQVGNAKEYQGKNILIIDDVFTTGATVNECARVLRKAGAREINVLTVARGE